MLNELGTNIWTLDGPEVIFAGAAMHTRMTVVRLDNGDLWIHSPIELSEPVLSSVKELGGSVSALIAPNKFHHMFMSAWQEAYPAAQVYAEPQVHKKIPALSCAEEITNSTPEQYSDEIDQVLFSGNRLFQEAVFFHKASHTLILTDLMLNLKAERVKFWPRQFLKFEGAIYPNGGVTRLYRWLTLDRAKAKQALSQIQAWEPKQITFCHGVTFLDNATNIIEKEFRWLLR